MPKQKRVIKKEKVKEIVESQSGIEYLITYGWAVLIISIILVLLFDLNVFSPSLRAQPGSCQVLRPLGPYSSVDLNTEGECTNMLPEFVSSFGTVNVSSHNSGKGYGKISYPDYIALSDNPLAYAIQATQGSQQVYPPGFTITGWIYWYGVNNAPCQGIIGNDPSPSDGIALFGYGGNNGACGVLWVNGSYVKWNPSSNNSFQKDRWIFVSAVYNQSNGTATIYTDMKVFSTSSLTPRNYQTSNSLTLGAVFYPNGDIYPFNGTLANLQLYDTPLSINELDALYTEGIGGVPNQLQNLVGWWPLNGNAQDYSGNGNSGVPTNVTFYTTYPST